MHPNPAFRQASAERNLAFAAARGFGVLTVNGPEGPLAAHVPCIVSDTHVDLHLARSNRIARALADPAKALLAIAGPDGYVSPDWYGLGHDQVPTWNYVAVHLRGTLELRPAEDLRDHLVALSAQFEERLAKTPWRIDKMPDGALEKMMRAIVPCRLTIETVEGTWKLNQNKPDAARASAAAALPGSVGQELEALSRLMGEE
jgi:transcriptional regulator